jgi:hypothetical protein
MKAHRRSRGITPLILNLGSEWKWRAGLVTPGSEWTGSWVYSRNCLDVLEERRSPTPAGIRAPDSPTTGYTLQTDVHQTPCSVRILAYHVKTFLLSKYSLSISSRVNDTWPDFNLGYCSGDMTIRIGHVTHLHTPDTPCQECHVPVPTAHWTLQRQ